MSAIEMMMKSFGINPDLIKTQVEKAGNDFKEVVKSFENRFERLKEDFTRLEKKIDMLLEVNQLKTLEKNEEGEE